MEEFSQSPDNFQEELSVLSARMALEHLLSPDPDRKTVGLRALMTVPLHLPESSQLAVQGWLLALASSDVSESMSAVEGLRAVTTAGVVGAAEAGWLVETSMRIARASDVDEP